MEIKFKQIRKLVRSILKDDIKSRCSDKWLYTKYLEMVQIEGLTASEQKMLIYLMRKAHLPNYSTVMRSRQDIQSKEPSLTENVTAKRRRELEEIYRQEFSK